MYIKAKKSLGQNFLIDREVLDQIVSTCDITNKEILEGADEINLKYKKVLEFKDKLQCIIIKK